MMMMMMVVVMMMMTRYHGDKEKTQVAAFTVLSTSPSLLSVITRAVPGDADYNHGNDDDNDNDDTDDNNDLVTTRDGLGDDHGNDDTDDDKAWKGWDLLLLRRSLFLFPGAYFLKKIPAPLSRRFLSEEGPNHETIIGMSYVHDIESN